MATTSEIRLAHELLDEINARQDLTPEQTEVLRSFLPELPKQKTLEELRHTVHAAWSGTHGNKWLDDVDGDLEAWLYELHTQLKGLKDAPAAEPENVAATAHSLPAGMRLADHEKYGRVVVSPRPGDFGLYLIFVLDSDYKEGAHWHLERPAMLTFIDAEPAKPAQSAHPEFLQTGAEYQEAPWGTIVAIEDFAIAWVKKGDSWSSTDGERRAESQFLWGVPRKVLRWGEHV